MNVARPSPVVHVELHTTALPDAQAFLAGLLGWRAERIHAGGGSYLALDAGCGPGGGIVECETAQPVWLPYVAVPDVAAATEHARRLGASVPLEPREGPAGWRSVVRSSAGGELALWQPKRE
jgi:predicted enzyme related to lactoylglutathione lyase